MKKTLAVFAALALCAGIASAEKYRVLMTAYKENGKTLEQIEKIAAENGGDFKKAVQICKDARAGKNPVAIPRELEKIEDGFDLVDELKAYGVEAVVSTESGVWAERPVLKKKGKGSASDGKGKK